MAQYKCPKCRVWLESPSSMGGQEDTCPACGQACKVPDERHASRRSGVSHSRHYSQEQKRRCWQTWFFLFLGVVWMAILGYLVVAAHLAFFTAVNPSRVIPDEEAQRWCVAGGAIAVGLWVLAASLLLWSAPCLLPRLVGAHLAVGKDADALSDAMRQTYEGLRDRRAKTKDCEARKLDKAVDGMRISSGLAAHESDSKLRWYVLETDACNAFAVGRSASNGAIVVTHGLLRSLKPDELQAVVAYELAHLMNGDAMFVVQALAFAWMVLGACMLAVGIAVAIALATALLVYLVVQFAKGGGLWLGLAAAIAAVVIVVMGLALFSTYVLIMAVVLLLAMVGVKAASSGIGQSREYLADACAVQWSPAHCPLAMASALTKVAGAGQLGGLKGAVAPLWLEDTGPEKEDGLRQRLLSFLIRTHPPINYRLERRRASRPSRTRMCTHAASGRSPASRRWRGW